MNPETPKRFQIFSALALATVLLMCIISLLIHSPFYSFPWFSDTQTLPIGLLAIGLILLLVIAACFTFIRSLRAINSGRISLGIILVILAFILFICPAFMMVTFTPVIIKITSSLR